MISPRWRRRCYEWKSRLGLNGWRHGSRQHWLQFVLRHWWRPRHPARRRPPWSAGQGPPPGDGAGVREPRTFSNLFAGHQRVAEPCGCPPSFFDEPRRHWQSSIHTDAQDEASEAWDQLLALIDHAADRGLTELAPGLELGPDLWRQIVTLPPTIARLERVKVLNLYGSNLHSIPPAIGHMRSLEIFSPYTSYRLHWFPYEIVGCTALRDSTVSTRALYGNYKFRPTFPRLPTRLPEASYPDRCSVCDTPHPRSELDQWWISLRVATDVLPLLAHVCSDHCRDSLGTPPVDYLDHPHRGGTELVQPD